MQEGQGTGPLLAALARDGFCFLEAGTTRGLLESHGSLRDWPEFAASWDTLEPDQYLAAVGRHRRRRYAVYRAESGAPIRREPHQPHFQSRHHNVLQGDIERWFEPIPPEVGESDALRTILEFCRTGFGQLAPATRHWHIEVHQFRIEAQADAPGEPTPEGIHRDGVEWVLALLVGRWNIAEGTTTIHGADGGELGSFTLSEAFDAALVDDRRVFHGVTPVRALDPTQPSHRDVLVVTLREAG